MLKKFIFLIATLSIWQAKAQYPLPDPASPGGFTNLVQPPPTAASLGKYVDFPVSFFTGIPSIDIPLYDLEDGDVEMPISLSYHASGIRVSEVASWVGLGWALNAGGVIMRTVRGTADEGSYSLQGNGYGAPTGYYLNNGLSAFPKLPYADANGQPQSFVGGSGLPYIHYAAQGLGSGTVDGESDLYTFNFNGHMGKFIFDESRTPRLLKDDNLKIIVNYNGTDFVSWVITDENGIQYYFGKNLNANNYERAFPTWGPQSITGQGPISSWYLNQIIYPNNNDTVNFTYASEGYYYADPGAEIESMSFEPVGTGSGNSPTLMCNNTVNNVTGISNPPKPNVTSLNGFRLTGISSKNINIVFEADNGRKDLNNLGMELDKIKIYSRLTGQCIKQFRFSYGYFASPFPNIWASANIPLPLCDSLRLKLLSLDEFSGDSSIVKPPYLFTYQDGFPLPRRLSFDQDHWGFSNNSGNPINTYLTPGGVWLTNIACTGYGGANREPSWPQMSAGTLLSIKDPLGAITTFQFEANQTAMPLVTGGTMIGGLRIKQITVSDSNTNATMIKQFQYGNGTLYKVPSYVSSYVNEFYLTESVGGTNGYLGNGYGLGRSPGALKQSQSIVPMQDADGAHIGYSSVTEIFGANGENGKKIFTYDQGIAQPENNSSKLNPNVFLGNDNFASPGPTLGIGVTGMGLFLGNGKFNEIPLSTLDSNFEPGYDNNTFYPSAPEQIDLTRGNLLQTQTYDASGNLLQQVNNMYDTTLHGGYSIRGVKGFENPAPNFANAIDDALTYYLLHTGICHLRYTATTNYEGGNPIVDTIRYSYESPFHTLATSVKSTKSNGDSLIQKTYYSFDYYPTATSDGVFGTMQQMNILAPVAKEVWENNTMTGSVVTAYGDFNTNVILGHVIKPSKIYMLATNTPLNTTQAGETSTYTGQKSALLPNNYYIERMDLNSDPVGKQLQVRKVNDKATSFQWGYGNAYPVAKVENAVNTYTIGQSSQAQYHTNQFVASSSQQANQTYTFSVYPAGTIYLSIGYGNNPGSNPVYNVGYTLSGTNSPLQTGTFCLGTGCPPQYLPTYISYTNMPVGTYTLTMTPYKNVNTANLPLNLSCSYSGLAPTSSGIKEFFYDGFEENSNSNVIIGAAHTGNKYWNGSTYPTAFALPDGRSYMIQWWNLSAGVWLFNQQVYTGNTALTGPVDDIRIFPIDALMTTYTYNPLIGMTSQIDPSGHSTYYNYDSSRRLIYVKDQDGNVIKKICYNYIGQQSTCQVSGPPPVGFSMSAINNNSTYVGYQVILTSTTGGGQQTFTVNAHGANSIGPIIPGLYNITINPPASDHSGLMAIISISGNSPLSSSGSSASFSNINVSPTNYNTINIY